MPTNPLHHSLEQTLAATIDAESADGVRWWAGAEMAPIAVRRWFSFERRHKQKSPTADDRVRDLAKGLQAHFEPETPFTAWAEWLHLAGKLAGVLSTHDPVGRD
jgi:hypothetical protein